MIVRKEILGNASRFERLADEYDQTRAAYPLAIFKDLFESNLRPFQTAVDIGSGTGKLLDVLLTCLPSTAQITTVEPGKDMLRLLKQNYSVNKRVKFIRCVAEKLELDEASVDLVSVGNAIHLFNAKEFSSEAARVLKEDGVLLVARNGRTPSDLNLSIDRFFEEMGAENSNWRHSLSETWSLPEPMLKWVTRLYRSENWIRSMSVEEYLRLELSRPHASQAARRTPAVDLHTLIRKIVDRNIKTEFVEVEYVCQVYALTRRAVAIT